MTPHEELRARLDELMAAEGRMARLEAALESIREYWNRDQNETAMANACWHAIETANEALSASKTDDKREEVSDSLCTYAAFAGQVCNKCGRIHDGKANDWGTSELDLIGGAS